jgi:regulator of replication initiation timing
MVMAEEDKEYELIPISPIRRLERRLDRVEKTSNSGDFSKELLDDVVDIVRMNQMLVDELAKSNDALRIELSKLPGRLDELITNTKELVSFIKASGEQEVSAIGPETMKPVVDKLDELVQENKKMSDKNDALLELLDDVGRKLKRRPNPMHRPPKKQQRPLPIKV